MFVLNMGISGVVSELRIRMLAVGRGTLGMMALKIEAMGIKGVISDMRSGMSDVGTAAGGRMALKIETTPGVGFTLVGTGNESGSDNPGLRNGGWPEEVGPGTGIIGGKVPFADIVVSCCTPG
ncbi:uncharacterized protein B0T23DRAFT_408872 [Neurospora hispaniola]|uniref:Uncharacterized protein n=1 Tax=Neurospora hispaniola TaxID=588809 RepID=A0AAJ0HXP6_9PEZI|nr:hypothetical protein B0T23DRAFT_408872 [Neurospora hispaniola]